MKKILILGSAGMLGHIVCNYLARLNKYEIIDASFPVKFRPESLLLDVTEKGQVEKEIKNINPDIIINCIGILIKGSIDDPSNAIYLNAYFPNHLVKILRETGGKLIHVSTDCVFSGNKGGYIENDFRDADTLYGRSKALGEIINENDLTIRTSIIGPELKVKGEGLFHWFMSQKGHVNGYSNVFWSGVTTLELARGIDKAINMDLKGLYHFVSQDKISKFDLLCLIKNIWKINDVVINRIDSVGHDKSLFDSRKLVIPNNYEIMLNELFEWMKKNNELYLSYSNFLSGR